MRQRATANMARLTLTKTTNGTTNPQSDDKTKLDNVFTKASEQLPECGHLWLSFLFFSHPVTWTQIPTKYVYFPRWEVTRLVLPFLVFRIVKYIPKSLIRILNVYM